MATKRKDRQFMGRERNSHEPGGGPKDDVLTLMTDRTGITKRSDMVRPKDVHNVEPSPSLRLGEENFFVSKSIEELAASQGIRPLTDLKRLSGVLADDEVEDFISAIYESRERH
jgi:hypothetical protein